MNRLRVKNIMISIILMCSTCFVSAQDPKITISVDRKSVLLGDELIFTISVNGVNNPEAPELPDLEGFVVHFRGARSSSFSSFTLIVQGETIEKRSSGGGYMFDYILIPKRQGMLKIPAMQLEIDGKKYKTVPIDIEVLDKAEESESIFIDVSINKNSIYLGEHLVIDFKWYINKDISAYRLNIPWISGLKNFLVNEEELDPSKKYQRIIVNGDEQVIAEKSTQFYKGQKYIVIAFQKTLSPIATGEYILDPVFLKCNVVTGYQRRRGGLSGYDLFDSDMDSLFGFGRKAITKTFSTRTEPIMITVRGVPEEGKTLDYTGAVGVFEFIVDVKPLSVKVGEPITITMKVRGTGDIDKIQIPEYEDIDGFRSYETESRIQKEKEDTGISKEKVFEKVLVPTKEGEYEMPVIHFKFFNPVQENYQTIARGPFQIIVEKGDIEQEQVQYIAVSDDLTNNGSVKEIKIIKKDIRYIKTALGDISRVKENYYQVMVVMFVLPPIFFLFFYALYARRTRYQTDLAYARQKRARGSIKNDLKMASRAMHHATTKEFYDALSRALCKYLSNKLNLPIGIVHTEIIVELEKYRVKSELIDRLAKLFEQCDRVRFSFHDVKMESMEEQLKNVDKMVLELEKALK